jgi:DNA invertase Pin-like site-specific DNA recombinase
MNYAYIRVSTEVQSYEGQRFEIENWCRQNGIQIDRWVQEKVSGTLRLQKRTLGKLLKQMKKGDILVCTELSRLGRNMMMVMSILNTCSQKGIQIRSIKDNFELSDSLNSKIIAFAFSLAAEIERNLISQRTREALAAKKYAGIKLGRPIGPSKQRKCFEEHYEVILRNLENGQTIKQIAQRLKMHPNTLSRYLKERKEGP